MSLENEVRRLPDEGYKFDQVLKEQKISYSRDFLLSLSNLNVCKKLPTGFDESLLCEFDAAIQSIQDRPRIPGSLPLQGFRRNEHGSSPPTRGDSGSYSRGTYGKWESRSSGLSDRDIDSQSDRESDSGRHYGHQSRQSKQTTEQDGLLGSGSFPRPPGYAAEFSAPKVRACEDYQLCKSNEVYNPPRPYKAVPYSRRDKDALNDKTFGSIDCDDEDRAEEEKRRRASFELMRKEQQKALQEKQNLNLGINANFSEVLGHKKEEKEQSFRNNELEISAATPTLNNDLEKSSFASQSSASRPLVPPGFRNNILEKSSGLESLQHPLLEVHDSKPGDTWKPTSLQSSKFTQWFSDEGTKPADDISSGRPNGLLSLIVGGDEGKHQVSDTEIADQSLRDFSYETLEQSKRLTLDSASAADGISDQVGLNNKKETVSTVLTCEDLEQSILTEYSADTAKIQPLSKGWSTNTNTEQLSKHVDDQASLQLLSLLQKGTDQSMTPSKAVNINLPDEPVVSQEHDMGTAVDKPKGEENGNSIVMSGKTVTLETLFGSAFMKELQSVDAPVSVHRGSTGSTEVDALEPHGLHFPVTDNDISSSAMDKIGLQRPSHDDRFLALNHRQQIKLSKGENWLNFDDSQRSTSAKQHPEELLTHNGFEEKVISAAERRNHHMSTAMPTHNFTNNVNSSANVPIDIMGKLAAISPVVKDERIMVGSESLPSTRRPYEHMEAELPYRSWVQQPSSQFHPPQMAQVRPSYSHLDSHLAHMSSQMKFLHPNVMFNHGSPTNHQFSSNMIQHPSHQPNIAIAGFDVPYRHSVVHQMQMSSNHTPHLLPNFPSSGPVSHHDNQAASLIHEINQKQGFPLGPRQPNIGNHGLPAPAPEGSPPEALQRLIEMELQANSKHIHSLAPNQGTHGHEVNIGLRYR